LNKQVVCGNNINLSTGVVLGKKHSGKKQGVPSIGNNVYFGPGAKVIGNVLIGNNIAIGANAVIVEDIPDHSAYIVKKGRIIPSNATNCMINNRYV